jgi:hypothetical protein
MIARRNADASFPRMSGQPARNSGVDDRKSVTATRIERAMQSKPIEGVH